jgi:hypothetical protein
MTVFSVSAGVAAPKMAGAAKPAAHGKMMAGAMKKHGKMVAFCSKCGMYYSKADAKKMKMMDPMGHKLTMTSMTNVPKTAKMGHMGMPMHHMGKMHMHRRVAGDRATATAAPKRYMHHRAHRKHHKHHMHHHKMHKM